MEATLERMVREGLTEEKAFNLRRIGKECSRGGAPCAHPLR